MIDPESFRDGFKMCVEISQIFRWDACFLR